MDEMKCQSCGVELTEETASRAVDMHWRPVGWQCRDGEACYQRVATRPLAVHWPHGHML